MSNNQYDIVIVGGGIVGATFACALATTSLRILLLDQQPLSEIKIPNDFDLRVSALNLGTVQILRDMNVWPLMSQHRISPFSSMHVWDGDGTGAVHFDASEIGKPALGYIIENSVILKGLYQYLNSKPTISIGCEPVKAFCLEEQGYQITLDSGETLMTSLLVGADGAHSHVRNLANIAMTERDYQHYAVVATVQTELAHQATAWQAFLQTGPLAFLPLTKDKKDQHHASIVWSTSASHAQHLIKAKPEDFCRELEQAFSARLGKIQEVSQRIAFPLIERHVDCYTQRRLALLGDAAHTIHPLAGQGLNLGILDAAVLAEEILLSMQQQRNWASDRVLRRYERRRKGQNWLMLKT